MAQIVAKYAAKKLMAGEMKKYRSRPVDEDYDPLYALVPDPKRPGKRKKVKKQVPDYIPEQDAVILARARKTAYRLDMCLFSLMGLRFGWSSVIGIVPAFGDGLDLLLASKLVLSMRGIEGGLPSGVLNRMLFNLALDFFLGLVPFLGDLADASYKVNSKNVRLLEEHLDATYRPKELLEREAKLKPDKRPRPATVYEDFSDEDEDRRNVYDDRHADVRRPTRAYSGRRERASDEEMGLPRQDTRKSHRRDDRPGQSGTKNSRR
ncbi:hypothetical protein BDV95DRAFT_676071 [Massariosphaeria phaeospora]|uniref:PH domain-containing protein n=1 Tax=Massariosphaeria phaeospora TaxID=100035 RepID=A0A7C8MAM0_9PLEO|nr:hypothetical protein BDV95DRAFT_676071 [Massariosphaeria phaeospora]